LFLPIFDIASSVDCTTPLGASDEIGTLVCSACTFVLVGGATTLVGQAAASR